MRNQVLDERLAVRERNLTSAEDLASWRGTLMRESEAITGGAWNAAIGEIRSRAKQQKDAIKDLRKLVDEAEEQGNKTEEKEALQKAWCDYATVCEKSQEV